MGYRLLSLRSYTHGKGINIVAIASPSYPTQLSEDRKYYFVSGNIEKELIVYEAGRCDHGLKNMKETWQEFVKDFPEYFVLNETGTQKYKLISKIVEPYLLVMTLQNTK